jgi:membrane protein
MNPISLLVAAAYRFYDRDADHLAASLAYYTPFALTPLILVSVTVLSFVFGSSYTVHVFKVWGEILGPELVTFLADAIGALRQDEGPLRVPVIGSLFFFGMIVLAFNLITSGFHHLWEVPHSGVGGWLRKSWRSVVFIFVLQAYLMVVMATDGLVASSGNSAFPLLPLLVAFTATVWLLYLMYRFLPLAPHSRRASLVGAVVASLLLMLAKNLIALYVSSASVPKLYDAAGLIVALLIWMYAAAAIIYFGAAVVYEYDRARGSRPPKAV